MTEEQAKFYGIDGMSYEENIRSLGRPCSLAEQNQQEAPVSPAMTEERLREMEFYATGTASHEWHIRLLVAEVRRLRAALEAPGGVHADDCGRAHYEGENVPCRCGAE